MSTHEEIHFGEPGDFMKVRHLKIRGSNFEIGRALGSLAIERYARTRANLEDDPVFVGAQNTIVQRDFPILWERMKGVAAAFDLDPADTRYDLRWLTYFMDLPAPAPGCSAVYYPPSTTATGHGYLSRNYDFTIGTLGELMQIPLPREVLAQTPSLMSEPYLMEWYPKDGGYASIAIHAFDVLGGTLDGINSEGLTVAILADHDAIHELGPRIERHPGPQRIVGLHELEVMRLLLDSCATTGEARHALLTVKQCYRFAPCHYIVADRHGDSFVYENSTGRNAQYVLDGGGRTQAVTNFQLHRHPTMETMPGGELTVENEAYFRYRALIDRTANRDGFTTDEMKQTQAAVNIVELINRMTIDSGRGGPLMAARARTVWHCLFDLDARSVDVSFYLGDEQRTDGTIQERRSDYVRFALEGS